MNDHYTYRVTWSPENNEHIGLCAEFPSLSWLAPTPAKALAGIQRMVRDSLADMENTGERRRSQSPTAHTAASSRPHTS